MRWVVLAGVLALAACARHTEAAAPPTPPPPPSASATPSPAPPSPTPSPSKPACELPGFATDCAGVKAFQERYGLRPVDGIVGPATRAVAQRLLASDPSRCEPAEYGVTACVDLTNQTTWLMEHGTVVYGPTVTRTGMPGFATPTGRYEVDWRALKDWSVPYKVWLPYWQAFNDGIGFHETTSYLHHASIGSHGCVNLLHTDAVAYWDRLEEGSSVHVFGNRPGT